jgi:hypothetical protein
MKKLLLFAGIGMLSASAFAQTARVQAIHNSADAAAATVDVWLTTPTGSSLLLDDFTFRSASPFVNAPAGVPISLGIAPANSTVVGDVIPGLSFSYNLTANETYVLVAEGIVSASGYSPATPFDIEVYAMGQESSAMMGNTDVLVHHGVTDAPTVDIYEASAGELVDDASYTDFAGYLQLATADYDLQVRDMTGNTILKAYDAPLATLNLTNQALVVVASGFLNPAVNSNGPAFGLYAALPTGGPLVMLPEKSARVQAIHNSADAATATVDVYMTTALGSSLLVDDFSFRNATPFIDAPAGGVDFSLAFAPGNSASANDTIAGLTFNYSLTENETYILVAEGIVSATGYSPATPFSIEVYAMGQETSFVMGNTDVLVHHGATDAPTVDVDEISAGNLVNDASYTDFAGYLQLATNDYTLLLKDASGTTTIQTYSAPLATLNLQGQAITVVASGFLNPANNSNGPAFGLWVALPAGGALVQLPENVATGLDEIENEVSIDVYPNPTNSMLNISGMDLESAQINIVDLSGRTVNTNLYRLNNNTIDVSNLAQGTYQLVLYNNSSIIDRVKFLKF